jgi:hypothetical protein
MTKEFKIIPWENKQDLLDVIDSRANMTVLKSSLKINQNFIDLDINRLDVYDHNIIVGLYIDNVLDCFMYMHLWSELPTYSRILITKYIPEGREKFPNTKHDKNAVTLLNFATSLMESKGYYNFYAQVQNTDWEPFQNNKECVMNRYRMTDVELIPSDKVSEYPLFRRHLSARSFDAPTKIVYSSLPVELRGNDKSTN